MSYVIYISHLKVWTMRYCWYQVQCWTYLNLNSRKSEKKSNKLSAACWHQKSKIWLINQRDVYTSFYAPIWLELDMKRKFLAWVEKQHFCNSQNTCVLSRHHSQLQYIIDPPGPGRIGGHYFSNVVSTSGKQRYNATQGQVGHFEVFLKTKISGF